MNIIAANISYNPYSWRQPYSNPKAGHKYVRDFPGHESLDFYFNKKGIDTNSHIFGYCCFQKTPKPDFFNVVIFYSFNYDKNIGEIIGIYVDVIHHKKIKIFAYNGFENDEYMCNLEANKSLSMLFPFPIESKIISNGRFVGQVGFTYKKEDILKNILQQEYQLLIGNNLLYDEIKKLDSIYYHLFNLKFPVSNDEAEQKEISDFLENENESIDILKSKLHNSYNSNERKINVISQQYNRDNYNISIIKRLRNNTCQICNNYIQMKNGNKYVEAAHIKPKHQGGDEKPENILVVCPNHHKEFDYGNLKIISHDSKKIKFILNGNNYLCNLEI